MTVPMPTAASSTPRAQYSRVAWCLRHRASAPRCASWVGVMDVPSAVIAWSAQADPAPCGRGRPDAVTGTGRSQRFATGRVDEVRLDVDVALPEGRPGDVDRHRRGIDVLLAGRRRIRRAAVHQAGGVIDLADDHQPCSDVAFQDTHGLRVQLGERRHRGHQVADVGERRVKTLGAVGRRLGRMHRHSGGRRAVACFKDVEFGCDDDSR